MSAKKILVVEDDRPSAAILAYKLKGSGYDVVIAPDGTEAVGLVRSEHPDLMILDLGLPTKNPFAGPNLDGFGVMAWLNRTQSTEPLLPTIVLTAWDPMTAQKRALDAGAIAFFQKPAQFDSRLTTIKSALGEGGNQPQSRS